jgi:hypothetical protein
MRQSRISTLEDPNYENFEAATLRRLASAFDVALTIRFIPFSELAGWTARLSSTAMEPPPDYSHDSLPSKIEIGWNGSATIKNIWSIIGQTKERIPAPPFIKPGLDCTPITPNQKENKPKFIGPGTNNSAARKVFSISESIRSFRVARFGDNPRKAA